MRSSRISTKFQSRLASQTGQPNCSSIRSCGEPTSCSGKLAGMNKGPAHVVNAIPWLNLAEFFETVPPGRSVTVSGIPVNEPYNPLRPAPPVQRLPQLRLHCEECDGERFFLSDSRFSWESTPSYCRHFVLYTCNNCGLQIKTYAIEVAQTDVEGVAGVFKYGEDPPFGPPLPSKLISLIGPEKDYFLKGRRAENQGLGIGAFAYYRRVIEGQKNRIIDEMIKAAKKLSATETVLNELNEAKTETRFRDAVQKVKHALPPGIMINGNNPLTLLHTALSEGLHVQTDEECLTLATHVRVVMMALAKQLASALEDDAELNLAVTQLAKKRAQAAK